MSDYLEYRQVGKAYAPRRDPITYADRHVAVGLFLGAWFVVIPLLTCIILLFLTAWLNMLGVSGDIHAMLWGWLSQRQLKYDSKGHPYHIWLVAGWVGAYFMMVFSAYLFYQFCELLWFGGKSFYRMLSK